MDKTNFTIGLAFSTKVVILQGRIINFKTVNSNREQVTQVDAISIYRQTIPPFIIFKGQQYTDSLQKTTEEAIKDYLIGITENSQLNKKMGLKQLKYFKQHTQ